MTSPQGSIDDPEAKIHPFKLHTGRQIYDTNRKVLVVPKLFGEDGYWTTYDWNRAAELGMASTGESYSGSYGFVDTEMYWPLNHMVVGGDLALRCIDCHGRGDHLDWQALGYEDDPVHVQRRKRKAEREGN